MENKTFALEFATNLLGKIKPEIKERLKRVIENPNQENWEEAYSIIIDGRGTMKTLWNAVIAIDPMMPRRKPLDSPWEYIPSSEIIVEAIKQVIFSKTNSELN